LVNLRFHPRMVRGFTLFTLYFPFGTHYSLKTKVKGQFGGVM